jgi:hypothetical protein
MRTTDLETRISRLERRNAIWQVAAVAAALVAVSNACSEKSAPPADHFELTSGGTKVRLDGGKLVIGNSASSMTLDAYGLVVTTGKQELTAKATEMVMTGCGPVSPGCKDANIAIKNGVVTITGPGGESIVKAGRLDLKHDGRSIKADVADDKDVWLVASAGGRSNVAMWVKHGVAALSTDVLPDNGEAPQTASIGVDSKGSSVNLKWKGTAKTFGLGQ